MKKWRQTTDSKKQVWKEYFGKVLAETYIEIITSRDTKAKGKMETTNFRRRKGSN